MPRGPDPDILARVQRVLAANPTVSNTEGARQAQCDRQVFARYRLECKATHVSPRDGAEIIVRPESPVGDAFGPTLPDPIERDTSPIVLDNPGHWLILSDVHIPFHDKTTIELAAKRAKDRNVTGIVLNGDILDCLGLSSKFHARPDDHTFKLERQYGIQFFAWLRFQFPKARIVYKLGNHEERLENYVAEKAPQLFDIAELSMSSLLELEAVGAELVQDCRLIYVGKLPVLHGHEYRQGISAPVNPARGWFLKAVHTILVGHSHQTSEHHARDVTGKAIATWSTGCACHLKPRYDPFAKWNHGFAFVEVANNGDFTVTNHRVLDGVVR